MSSILDYTDIGFIKFLDAKNKLSAIEELASVFHETDSCDNLPLLVQALKEREEIMSTGIGFGIAIPHAKIQTVKKISYAIGISKKGINFDSMDGELVRLIILVIAGENQHRDYLKLLSHIMSILKKDDIKEKIISSESSKNVLDILSSEEHKI